MGTYRSRKRLPQGVGILAIAGLAIVFTALALGNRTLDPGSAEQPAAENAVAAPEDTRSPTPFFASYRSLQLALPVEPDAVSLVAFHQASGKKSLHMESLVPEADAAEVERRTKAGEAVNASILASEAQDASEVPSSIWHGAALRLWRSNRSGPPDTAVDIGAAPGTEVRSPVSGKVLAIRPYKLYGSFDDFEIHIQPNGWPEVDVVLIHVSDPAVSEGDQVVAGVTSVARVRGLSKLTSLQLAGYTGDGGDHVHIQLNRMPVPGVLEPVGES